MKHLKDHGLGYFEHMTVAFCYAIELAIMSVVAVIHGFLPFVFKTYVTDKMKNLIEKP